MLRPAALAVLLLGTGASAQAVLEEEGMAGIGVQGCETVSGTQNTPVLAAAVDWGLGYLAGRRDGGQDLVAGEPLSTTDPADLAVGIVLYCRENPRGLVLDALRAYGLRVFGEGPLDDPLSRSRAPRVPPVPRPPDDPPDAVLARIEAARAERRLEAVETAAAAAVLGAVAGEAALAGRMAVGSVPPLGLVSRRAGGIESPGVDGPASGPPETSPRPPRRILVGARPSGPR